MNFLPRFRRDLNRLRQSKGRGLFPALLDGLFFDNGFQALVTYRISHTMKRWHIPIVPAVFRKLGNILCSVDLAPLAEIGGGCILPHGVGIVTGSDVVIGEDCTLLHRVTIGEARFDGSASPTVGDRVTIGAGATVLGDIRIGDDAVIGAGAVVLEDIPAGATVAGVPARIVNRDGIV